MVRKICILFAAIIIIGLIQWDWTGSLLMVLCVLILLYYCILLIIFFRYFLKKKRLKNTFLGYPLILLLLIFMGFSIIYIFSPSPILNTNVPIDQQLKYMHKTDQYDRKSLLFIFPERDKKRIEKVKIYLAKKAIKTPQNKFYSALILQHGHESSDFKKAYDLASDAATHEIEGAKWLKKATYDRWQISLGNPQKFGTQTNIGPVD